MRSVVTTSRRLVVSLVLILSAPTFGSERAEFRKWTDSSGKYHTDAQFVELKDGRVSLKRREGRIVSVPIEKLSAEDRAYATAAADAEGKDEIKEFTGSFQTGFFAGAGDELHDVPIFRDGTRPSVIKSKDDKVSAELLKGICSNCESCWSFPALARQLNQQSNPLLHTDALHIAVITLKTIPVFREFKDPWHFEPGSITRLQDVREKYGKPTELERWVAKDFQTWIGFNGTVYWWGAVGIGASEDGSITHILIREKEALPDKSTSSESTSSRESEIPREWDEKKLAILPDEFLAPFLEACQIIIRDKKGDGYAFTYDPNPNSLTDDIMLTAPAPEAVLNAIETRLQKRTDPLTFTPSCWSSGPSGSVVTAGEIWEEASKNARRKYGKE